MPDHIILLLHSAVFALSNNSTEVKNESVGWQDVARNIGLGAHAASGLKSCSKIRPTTKNSYNRCVVCKAFIHPAIMMDSNASRMVSMRERSVDP